MSFLLKIENIAKSSKFSHSAEIIFCVRGLTIKKVGKCVLYDPNESILISIIDTPNLYGSLRTIRGMTDLKSIMYKNN